MFRLPWRRRGGASGSADSSGRANGDGDSVGNDVGKADRRDWLDDLTDEERDRIVEKVAQSVVRHKMETAAILFLEMHKPVSFMASQGLVVLSPFTAPFVGMENVQLASKLIEKRENVEVLIRRIEELSVEKEAEERSAKMIARSTNKTARRKEKLDPATD